jgi:hypothetical protein
MKNPNKLLAAAAFCLPLALPLSAMAEGTSPWLLIPGDVAITISQTQQSGDTAYVGSTELPLSAITGGGATKFKRSTTRLGVAYGISDSLAVDLTLGRGNVKVGKADNSSGAVDSVLGLSWRLFDEYEQGGGPTVTLRAAAIRKGSYEGARLAALGNAANGYELSALVGKQLTPKVAVWAEAGFQNRSNSVPTATFFEVAMRYNVLPALSLSAAYSEKNYGGSLDIGGPGFSPARFQQVKAERGLVKLGAGYAIARNQGLAVSLARATSGRNSVKDDQVLGLAYTIAF